MRNSLSVAKIRGLEPQAKRFEVSDGRGLALEVNPSGLMAWRWRYMLRGRPSKINLGRFPHLSLADARQRRDVLLAAVREGRSPAEQRRLENQSQGMTIERFAELWLTRQVSRKREDLKPIRRYLARDVYPVIGKKPLASVEKKDFREIIEAKLDAERPQAALALRNIFKRIWDYAVECEITDKSADVMIPKAKYVAEKSERSRALKEAEIRLFLRALETARLKPQLKDALLLILLTLVRKSELRLARWVEFDLERAEWALPEEHSKMDTALMIPLSRQERDPGAGIISEKRLYAALLLVAEGNKFQAGFCGECRFKTLQRGRGERDFAEKIHAAEQPIQFVIIHDGQSPPFTRVNFNGDAIFLAAGGGAGGFLAADINHGAAGGNRPHQAEALDDDHARLRLKKPDFGLERVGVLRARGKCQRADGGNYDNAYFTHGFLHSETLFHGIFSNSAWVKTRAANGARCRVRTCDPFSVNEVLYH